MFFAKFAEVIDHLWCVFFELDARCLLAIENPKRIFFIPPFAILAKGIEVLAVIGKKLLAVGRSADFISNTVYVNNDIFDTERLKRAHKNANHNRVIDRVIIPYNLNPRLPKFTIAPCLRRLMAEKRPAIK